MNEVLKITLDTNLLHEYWKKRPKYGVIEQLISLANKGEIDLAVTARIREDIPDSPLADEINKLYLINISETGSITRLGYWELGRDTFCDDAMKEYWENILQNGGKEGVKYPDWRDQDHIHAHYVQNRDIFLTWDKAILTLAEDLKAKFGVIVMTPENFLSNPKM